MKHLIKIIMFFALLVAFESCQHQYPAGLVEVDSLMSSNPKLALEKLDSTSACLDTTDMEDLMYSRLLRVSVADKLYISHYNLLEVQKLVDYYESKNDVILLPKAYYIMGRVLSDLGDVTRALAAFHKVLDCLTEKDNLKLRGVTNAQLGEIFTKQENTKSALIFFKEAYRCDSVLGDKKGQLFDLRDIALSYDYLEKRDSARMVLRKAIQRAWLLNERRLISELAFSMANSYLEINRDSVEKYLLLSLRNSKNDSEHHQYVKSVYFQLMNESDSAVFYLKKMLKTTNEAIREDVLKRLVASSFESKRLDDAYCYYELFLECTDSLSMEDNKLEEAKDIALYDYVYQVEHGQKLERSNNRKMIILIVLFLICVIIFFFFLFYWQMSIVNKLRLQSRIKDWKITRMSINDNHKENARIREVMKLDLLVEMQRHLTSEDLQCLASKVELVYPNFRDNIYSCCAISEHEYHICLLVKIEVMTSKIAVLLNRAPSTISTAKQRLYKKLTKEKGNAEQFDNLIDAF